MVAKREKKVGRFKVEVEFANYDDIGRSERRGNLAALRRFAALRCWAL